MIIHETYKDRVKENLVLSRFCGDILTFKQLPQLSRLDAMLYRNGQLWGCAEVKCRGVMHDEFRHFFITLEKWEEGCELARRLHIKFLILVQYRDGLFYSNETGKRKDEDGRYIKQVTCQNRNGYVDNDFMIHIPIYLFKRRRE